MGIKFILNFSHCTILTNLFTFAKEKRCCFLEATDNNREFKVEKWLRGAIV